MTRAKKPEATAKGLKIQEALEGIQSGRFKSAYHALREMPDIRRSTLYTRMKGTLPREKAHEDQQNLSNAEEGELVQWISQMTRVNPCSIAPTCSSYG